MSNKNKETKPIKGLKREVRESHREEMQFILHQTELPIIHKFSDENFDRENEKFLLLSGVETSWKELKEAHLKLKKHINSKLREWEFTFPEDLYRQWRRLKGWDMNSKSRPMIFAAYTVRDIYGSLPREIYTTLEGINEYIYPGIRMYRYCPNFLLKNAMKK